MLLEHLYHLVILYILEGRGQAFGRETKFLGPFLEASRISQEMGSPSCMWFKNFYHLHDGCLCERLASTIVWRIIGAKVCGKRVGLLE